MRLPKLLMISGDRALAAGAHGAFHSTLDCFRRHWERIDVICPRPDGGVARERNIFDEVVVHPSPWPSLLQWRWIAEKGRELVARHGHELATVHEYPPFFNGLGAWLLHRETGIPYVLEIHHVPGHPRASNVREWLDRSASRVWLRFDARRARAVRVVNEREVPSFLRAAGVPAEKIFVSSSLYIDRAVFRPIDLPKEWDIVFVGRLVANKGLSHVIDAATAGKFRVAIVGDGPLRGELETKLRSRGLEASVTLLGWLPGPADVASVINRSRVLVAPSDNEGGPRVVAEAMACGVPFLATPVGIVPDLVSAARVGVLVDWDGADIARKARELFEDRTAYQEMRARGLSLVERFDRESTVRAYAERLQRLLPPAEK